MSIPPPSEPGPYDGTVPSFSSAPTQGYEVPTDHPTWYPPVDPLVTGRDEGFSGWMNRLFTTLGRSWRQLALISVVTVGVPTAAVSVLSSFAGGVFRPGRGGRLGLDGDASDVNFSVLRDLVIVLIVVAIVSAYLLAVSNAAAIWTVTRAANRRPAPLGGALAYGYRNGFRLFGWSLLYGLMVVGGACLCLVPGVYLALAGSLYIPIALYQPGTSPISASFSMIHRRFWPSVGRIALVFAMVLAVRFVLDVPVAFVEAASRPAGIVVSTVVSLVSSALTLAGTVGSALVFAELRNQEVGITTEQLDAALG